MNTVQSEHNRTLWTAAAAIVLLTFSGVVGCSQAESAADQGDPDAATGTTKEDISIAVSIQPQKYFVERIAGPKAKVTVMVPPGKEPATYTPTPRQISKLSEAQLYFRIRVPFEESLIPRLERSLENLRIVDTTADIERRQLTVHEQQNAAKGAEAPADTPSRKGAVDPHVWLGPMEVQAQAAAIRDALIRRRPANEARYRENYESFAADINRLHERLSQRLAPIEGATMFVFHPAFGYFADTYGLEQKAIETGGKEPSSAQLEQIIETAQAEGVRVIFVQPQFDRSAAEQVAEAIDGAVVPIDPLAENWLENMETIAKREKAGVQ